MNEADLIHFGDVVDIDVLGSFEFDWRGKLDSNGFLDVMTTYGEPIYGLCRSDTEIAASTATALSKILRSPEVVVRIVDRSNRAVVTMDGSVRNPYRFQLRRPVRLRELIVIAGGLTDDASGEIQIFRPPDLNCFDIKDVSKDNTKPGQSSLRNDKDPPIFIVRVADLLGGKLDADPLIHSGDLITVLRAAPIYVIGGVNEPRPILSRPDLTLSRAIAIAGGLAKEAAKGNITIYRRESGVVTVIEADLDKITAGTLADPEVRALDIIDVPQRNKPKLKFPPVIESTHTDRLAVLPLRIVE